MLEFLAFFTIAGVALVVLTVLLVLGFFLKLTFRLLLLPLTLLGGLLKIVGLVLLVLIGVALAPVLFGFLAILALPFLLLAGLFGLGWAVATG